MENRTNHFVVGFLTTIIALGMGMKSVMGQVEGPPSTQEEIEAQYAENITKTRLYGVYIPVDLTDAFEELIALSPPHAIENFKLAEESEVVSRLHHGVGRWMMLNWHFYEGSRFSHHLKEKGILDPDDMIRFVLTTFHRHLNEKPLREEELIERFRFEKSEMMKKRRQLKIEE